MKQKRESVTLDAEQLNSTDVGILELLHEGRGSPRYIAEVLGKQQPYINQRLKRLLEHGHVERIDRGLYELSTPPEEAENGTTYRQKALDCYGEKCVDCGATDAIEIHHINRDRDDNRVENLIPLCRSCHRSLHNEGDTVTYQFQIPDDDWVVWKNTVPRSKALDVRLRELIEADADGRVASAEVEPTPEATEPTQPGTQELQPLTADARERLREELAGSGDLLDRRVEAIEKMYDVLRERGEAEKDELLDAVDVGATGYASRDSVWSNMVKGKDTLSALPGVESPPTGRSEWRYNND